MAWVILVYVTQNGKQKENSSDTVMTLNVIIITSVTDDLLSLVSQTDSCVIIYLAHSLAFHWKPAFNLLSLLCVLSQTSTGVITVASVAVCFISVTFKNGNATLLDNALSFPFLLTLFWKTNFRIIPNHKNNRQYTMYYTLKCNLQNIFLKKIWVRKDIFLGKDSKSFQWKA